MFAPTTKPQQSTNTITRITTEGTGSRVYLNCSKTGGRCALKLASICSVSFLGSSCSYINDRLRSEVSVLLPNFCLSHCYLDTSGILSVKTKRSFMLSVWSFILSCHINLFLNSAAAQVVFLFNNTLKSITTSAEMRDYLLVVRLGIDGIMIHNNILDDQWIMRGAFKVSCLKRAMHPLDNKSTRMQRCKIIYLYRHNVHSSRPLPGSE